ncbi:MAG TPA: hypothetical protein VE972_05510 [Conexibacter sp.]|nr:hypothetical protein [Conexibacter sp.]
MPTRRKLALIAVAAVIVLAVLTAQAGALRSLNFSPGGEIMATGRWVITGGAAEFTANITLRGTIARAIAKRAGAHIGTITGGAARECAVRRPAGWTCVYTTGPLVGETWDIAYSSFLGTLPTITGVLLTINEETFLTSEREPLGRTIECLYKGRTAVLGRVNGERLLNEITYLTGDSMPLFRILEGACPESIGISGGWTFTTERVTLI